MIDEGLQERNDVVDGWLEAQQRPAASPVHRETILTPDGPVYFEAASLLQLRVVVDDALNGLRDRGIKMHKVEMWVAELTGGKPDKHDPKELYDWPPPSADELRDFRGVK